MNINKSTKTHTEKKDFLFDHSKPVRIVEYFAGLGTPRMALMNLGIPHTSVISEIDKHAIASYNAIHGDTPNLGDIRNVRSVPECDILTAGFPCQSLSIAGKKEGMKKDSGTESSLGWEIIRTLENADVLPAVVKVENSDQFTSKRNVRDAESFINALAKLGYTISKKIINAKNYGSPQNRSRIYIVACLDGTYYQFPDEIPLTTSLKDKLEENVASKYYLTAEQIAKYEAHKEKHQAAGHGFGWNPHDVEDDTAFSLSCNPTRNCGNFIRQPLSLSTRWGH